MKKILLFFLITIFLVQSVTVRAETIEIKPSRDLFVYSGIPSRNYENRIDLHIGNYRGEGVLRTLLYFDTSEFKDKNIKHISLKIKCFTSYGNKPLTVELHKITEEWDSTTTWDSKPEFDSEVIDSKEVESQGYYTFTIPAEVIKSDDYFGFLLKASNENENVDKVFFSSEILDKGPKLVVEYEGQSILQDCEEAGGTCIFNWQKCDGHVDTNLNCGFLKKCCVNCVGEGGSLGAVTPENNKVCCPGLTHILPSFPSQGGCKVLSGVRGYCTKCGDGVCKEPENECNCPDDCAGEEECSCGENDNGKNIFKKGMTTVTCEGGGAAGVELNPDECVDSSHVKEFYCDGNRAESEVLECPSGYYCEDGACVELPRLEILNFTDLNTIKLKIGSYIDEVNLHRNKRLGPFTATFVSYYYPYQNSTLSQGDEPSSIHDPFESDDFNVSLIRVVDDERDDKAEIKVNGESKLVKLFNNYVIGGKHVFVRDVFVYDQPVKGGGVQLYFLSPYNQGKPYDNYKPVIFVSVYNLTDEDHSYLYACVHHLYDVDGNYRGEDYYRCSLSRVLKLKRTADCFDSDKDTSKRGLTIGFSKQNFPAVMMGIDSCFGSHKVTEYYCNFDSSSSTPYFGPSFDSRVEECPSGCENGACVKVSSPINMLIFLSPQYAKDSDIKKAVNTYIRAVKEDINWNSKIIFLSEENNDYRKIDEIIERYHKSSGIKAAIMIGEDINTPPLVDRYSIETPSITPWASLEPYELSNGCVVISGDRRKIDVVISLLYPPHNLDYTERKSQIINVLKKFSQNRNQIYPKEFLAFISHPLAENAPDIVEDLQSLDKYGKLWYKESPTAEDLQSSLNTKYGIYTAVGHANPSHIVFKPQHNNFEGVYFKYSDLQNIHAPLFLGQGCNVAGWYCWPDCSNNQKLDYSSDDKWFGAKIFTNPDLRALVLGSPSQVCRGETNFDFFGQALPDLMKGKTLAESLSGKYLCFPDDDVIYGDPTFHFNWQQCVDSDEGKDYSVKGTVTYNDQEYNDTCDDDDTLKEYYCEDGELKSETHACGSGYICQDGACVEGSVCDSDGVCESENGETVENCPEDCKLSVSILSPSDGDKLEADSTVKVEWIIKNAEALLHDTQTIKTRILFYGGSDWSFVVWSLPLSDTSYDWHVPDIACNNCRLRVGVYKVTDPHHPERGPWVVYDNITFSIKRGQTQSCESVGGTCIWFYTSCRGYLAPQYSCPLFKRCCIRVPAKFR